MIFRETDVEARPPTKPQTFPRRRPCVVVDPFFLHGLSMLTPDETHAIFGRLLDAIDGGNRLDPRFRELRACVNLLKMHVLEAEPDVNIFATIERLLTQLAELRGLPSERIRDVARALQAIRSLVPRPP